MPGGDQKTRRFRNEKQSEKENDRRNNLDPKHPLPGLEPEPKGSTRSSCGAGNEIIAHEREEQTEDDRQLLERREAAANARRSDLADVSGTDDAGRANGNPAHYSQDDELNRDGSDPRAPWAPAQR